MLPEPAGAASSNCCKPVSHFRLVIRPYCMSTTNNRRGDILPGRTGHRPPTIKNRPAWVVMGAIVAVTAVCATIAAQLPVVPNPQPSVEGLVAPARALPPFQLRRAVGTANATFTRNDLRGHWSLIYSGYTRCPDACPSALGTLRGIYRHLPPTAHPRLKVVFVTVDPDGDTPADLAAYAQAIHPSAEAVTGPPHALDPLLRGLGFLPSGKSAATNPRFAHSSMIALVAPDATLRALFRAPFDAAAIARTIPQTSNPSLESHQTGDAL